MDALTVDTLAEVLQEPNRPLLMQVLRTLGQDRTRAVLTATLQCEANGGMRTKDGTRRRTPGGTFFQLARRTPAAVPPARIPAQPGPEGADLGGGQQPHADTRHRTTRRGTHDETDADRQTRQD
jgi:hypothetical protein